MENKKKKIKKQLIGMSYTHIVDLLSEIRFELRKELIDESIVYKG